MWRPFSVSVIFILLNNANRAAKGESMNRPGIITPSPCTDST